METPFKKIVVYDLETGGLNHKINSVTEIAAVVIDTNSLEKIDEFSVLIKPYLDLSFLKDSSANKLAKAIFKSIAEKDVETNVKTLEFGDKKITLKTIHELEIGIEEFVKFVDDAGLAEASISIEELLKVLSGKFSDVVDVVFKYIYNPQALSITHISRDMLFSEGVDFKEATSEFLKFLKKHTVGNKKPLLAGHNILEFDNNFLEKLLLIGAKTNLGSVAGRSIDTLDLAHLTWYNLSNYTLGSCTNEMNLSFSEAHRAINDVSANAKLLIKMLKNLRGEGTSKVKYKRKKYTFNF